MVVQQFGLHAPGRRYRKGDRQGLVRRYRALALAKDDKLFYPADRTDYIRIIREGNRVIALDFYVDGVPPARREVVVSRQ